jgi:outer membrane protein assembly factor BamB
VLNRGRGYFATVLACLFMGLVPASALAGVPAWTTYRHDGSRSGIDPDSVSPVAPSQVWQSAPLDGPVWAEPLLYGSTVYVATENDTVYALNAADGAVLWQQHLATPVDPSHLACGGDIYPAVGITSTPVIDPSTGRIYVVADTWNGSSASHQLYALNLSDGTIGVGPVNVDPPGSTPSAQLQRAGLALDAGKVIIGYGGNDGDCGTYHGWLVAVPEGGGPLQTFEVDRNTREGAIWGSGNAPAVDSAGDIWISTGNGSGAWDYQESVIKLDSNLNRLDWWSPLNWSSLDSHDRDLGSSMPVLLPDGLVFEIGKAGEGYLLNASNLGRTNTGPPLYSAPVCNGSWGGAIYVNGVIYVTCADGLHALSLNTGNDTFAPLSGWQLNSGAVGPPIFAGGLVWTAGASANSQTGGLYALNPATGATMFYADLGSYEHFATPSAGGGLLFVASQGDSTTGPAEITAFRIANVPSSGGGSPTPSSSPGPPAPEIVHLYTRRVRGKLRFKVALSEPAEVRIVVWRLLDGRLRHGRCHAYAKHGRRCAVLAYWLARHRNLEAGMSGLRLHMRPLPRGAYVLTVTAIGPGGRSQTRTVQLTIDHRW